MTLTRTQKEAATKHLLEVVFDEDPDSSLHKAFAYNKIKCPPDLIMLGDDTIDMLQYQETDKTLKLLSPVEIALLKCFKAFVFFKDQSGTPIDDTQWMKVSADEFNQFCISSDYLSAQYSQPATSVRVTDPIQTWYQM